MNDRDNFESEKLRAARKAELEPLVSGGIRDTGLRREHANASGLRPSFKTRGEFSSRRFLNPAEAAEFLGGLNVRTVVRWAREGYIPAIPIGEGKRRLWRFNAQDLEDWMLSRRTGTLLPAADASTGGF